MIPGTQEFLRGPFIRFFLELLYLIDRIFELAIQRLATLNISIRGRGIDRGDAEGDKIVQMGDLKSGAQKVMEQIAITEVRAYRVFLPNSAGAPMDVSRIVL